MPKDPSMHKVPTLTKLAVFYGATTIKGSIHDAKNRKRQPTQNNATKYG